MPASGAWRQWILLAEPADFWIWASLAAVFAMLLAYGVFHYLHRARLIENTPTSKVRSAVQGYVELHGSAQYLSAMPLQAPLTGTSCVWFRYKIEQRRTVHFGRGSKRLWMTLESSTSETPFLLQDDTGSCLIDARGAKITPTESDSWYGHHRFPQRKPGNTDPGLLGMLMDGGNNFRYTEERLHAHDTLYVLGDFKTVTGASDELVLGQQVAKLLKVWKHDQVELKKRFDSNADGVIDEQEWNDARSMAEAEVLKSRLEQAAVPALDVLSKPRLRRRPFLISHLPEHALSRRFRWRSLACGVGFLLMGPVAFWSMLLRWAA